MNWRERVADDDNDIMMIGKIRRRCIFSNHRKQYYTVSGIEFVCFRFELYVPGEFNSAKNLHNQVKKIPLQI